MTTTTTNPDLEAALARDAEAKAAWEAGDYAAAARDWTKAAEHLDNVWWQMHRDRPSADAANMRRNARAAIKARDAQEQPRIKLEGRVGGWQ